MNSPLLKKVKPRFEKDTVLFAYTDGVTECENSNGEFLEPAGCSIYCNNSPLRQVPLSLTSRLFRN